MRAIRQRRELPTPHESYRYPRRTIHFPWAGPRIGSHKATVNGIPVTISAGLVVTHLHNAITVGDDRARGGTPFRVEGTLLRHRAHTLADAHGEPECGHCGQHAVHL